MKKIAQNRIFCLGVALLLCLCLSFPALAAVPDLNKTGSVSVTMSYDGEPVSGGTLTIYRVGEIVEENGNYSYALTDDFSGSGVSLTNLDDSELSKTLAEYAENNALTGTSENIGNDGAVTIENLSTGLYLVVQTKAAEGFRAVSPFLVSIPTEENGEYVYEVDATPKLSALVEEDTSSSTSDDTSSEDTSGETSSGDTSSDETSGDSSEDTSDSTSESTEKLPQTGQHNLPVVILTFSGLCLLLIGFALRTKSDEK